MFGYIVVNQPELKMKEYDEYRKYYCGLCKSLKDRYGARGQISLSYDMTFLVLLLTGLYEPEKHSGSRRCIAHPTSKHTYVQNEYTDYVADMNVILTYYKCIDDWDDEHMLTRKLYADVLLSGQNGRRLKEDYQQKIQVIAENLKAISELEEAGSDDMDALSGHFGNIMAEICAPKHDEWESYLRTIGYYLGKFVYIMDAYDDIEKDIGAGNYNPFVCRLAHELGVEVQSVGVDKTIEQDKVWYADRDPKTNEPKTTAQMFFTVYYAEKGDKMLHHFQGKIEIGTGNGGIISQLKMQNEMKLTDESWISYQQEKGNARKRKETVDS